ncbi:glycosyltransferase [Caproicibacter fermentans]|uniref:Glycosyltransferase n=1 Tax=Caproicibacter fermentans TaxID=2576756 RepID=A0A7G8T7C1_9FIRM|nr:glycosyltransferase [Caproicibacter fermentans]QNK39512.1 glycosyltransferase [Caproicibacter fermentans]
MTQKILYCASTLSHIRNFHLPYLRAFHEMGYEVWVAADQAASVPYADRVVALPMQKKFLSPGNLSAVLKARKLIRTQRFDLVSTHTELASAIVRAGILLLRKRPKVVCTVHGYLFQENDGLKKWKYLIPEKLCARVTDVLMVMNHEDEEIARKYKLYRDKLYYIDGMGIDLTKFNPVSPEERAAERKKLGLSKQDFAYIYAAEFSERKNQGFLIRTFSELCRESSANSWLYLAGDGALLDESKELARQLHVDGRICFLGYVANIRELYAGCDACVSVSKIEGLPFNLMEAMACGLPVVASNIKGHRELVKSKGCGLLFPTENSVALKHALKAVRDRQRVSVNRNFITRFDIQTVLPKIIQIYRENGA